MKVSLNCSLEIRKTVLELLRTRGVEIDDNAEVALTQKGFDLPEGKVSIVFQNSALDKLIDFFDNNLIKSENAENKSSVIVGKANDRYELIFLDKILFFESRGNNTYCNTVTGQYRVKEKLYELEKTLMSKGFIRVAKCHVVNLPNISEIIPWFGGRLLLKLNDTRTEIEVARSYVRSFKDFLGL